MTDLDVAEADGGRAGRVPYSDHKLPTLIAIVRARLLVSEANAQRTIGGYPATLIRTEDLKIILDALDPQC